MLHIIKIPTNTSHNFIHSVNGNQYKVHIRYDNFSDSYYMNIDIYDSGVYRNIINSVMFVTGINLFLQYQYYDLGTFMIIPIIEGEYEKVPISSTIVSKFVIAWEHN